MEIYLLLSLVIYEIESSITLLNYWKNNAVQSGSIYCGYNSVNSNNLTGVMYTDSSSLYMYFSYLGYDYEDNYAATISTTEITSLMGLDFQLRTAPFNPMNATNMTFLMFSNIYLSLYTNNWRNLNTIYVNSSQTFI
jgi:hypothetical protein